MNYKVGKRGRYCGRICMGGQRIRSYSISGLRYPCTERGRTTLKRQYWVGRLGLVSFAHKQLHKSKSGRSRWSKLGLNDTR